MAAVGTGEEAAEEARLAGADDVAFLQAPDLDSQIVGLALPALVGLCAEPVLSIIDTGFIGHLPDPALSLGGLGVATTIFDSIFRCYNFLCVVTVPLVAQAAVAQTRGDRDAMAPAQITGRIVGLAASLGTITLASLLLGMPLALELAGSSPDAPIGAIAAQYLGIRAWALPASLVNTVAVGAFRGQLDTSTPLGVVLMQTLANVFLDAALVFGVEPLGVPAMGVEGAALATTISVWLSCGAFGLLLDRRGMVAWSAALTWPRALAELPELAVGSLSQLLRTVALQAVLLQFTSAVVGIDSGGLAAAAHQIALRIWFFALFALDSVAVAAQGLLPTALAGAGREKARRVALRLLFWGFAGGCLSGLALACASGAIPGAFTDSGEVQAAARPLVLLVAALQPLAGLVFAWDGVFQGLSDYSYLAVAMIVAATVTLVVLQQPLFCGSLEGVWICFALFLLLRAGGLAWRFWGPGGPLAAATERSEEGS